MQCCLHVFSLTHINRKLIDCMFLTFPLQLQLSAWWWSLQIPEQVTKSDENEFLVGFFLILKNVGNNFWKWSGENSCRHIIPEKDIYQTVKRATKRKTLLARPKMHGVVPYQGGKAAAQIRPLAGHRQTVITNTLYGPSLHRKWWWHYVIAKPWLLFNTWIRNDSEDQLKSWFSWIWNDL